MIHYSIEIRDVEPICSVFRYFLGEEKGACTKIHPGIVSQKFF